MAAIAQTMGEFEAARKGNRVLYVTLTATQIFAVVYNLTSPHTPELWVITA